MASSPSIQNGQAGSAVAKKRAFISFDIEHDDDLRLIVARQAELPDTPFDVADRSTKELPTGAWKEKVRNRLKNVDLMIVICGEHTDSANGVSAELSMARELGIPYILLKGRSDRRCVKPKSASALEKMYSWTRDNLKVLIAGGS